MYIFHITSRSGWERALRLGRYEASSLAQQGFIHCSTAEQVVRVANHLFRGTPGLVLLRIATGKLVAPVVYENLEGGPELFPHVYGPINLDAVEAATPFEPAPDGTFDHHRL